MKKAKVTEVNSFSSPKFGLIPKYRDARLFGTIFLFIAVLCVWAAIVVKGYAYPADRISLISSTAQPAETADQPGQWQTVRMRVTAYCPCSKCCGKSADGITANGHKIHSGDTLTAADKKFSFGTEMIIPGYNNGEPVKVLDRGGAIRGNRLDVLFHSHRQAQEWGVRYLDVKVRQE